jgi:hypothetical protein
MLKKTERNSVTYDSQWSEDQKLNKEKIGQDRISEY